MRKELPIAGTVAAFFLGFLYFRKKKSGRIYFDEEKACNNIRPLAVLKNYTRRFEKLYCSSDKEIVLPKDSFPTTINYYWDAFAALVSKVKAEKVRIDFGINNDGKLVLCIFPANENGDIIEAQLVPGCPGCEDEEAKRRIQSFAGPLSVMMAGTSTTATAQGLDDGQRVPAAS